VNLPAGTRRGVLIHTVPHAHGDHFHVGPAVVSVRDATGLSNPNVLNALARKGLLLAERTGLPVLTAEGARLRHGDCRRDPAQR
jgi:hypothetical protein